MFGHKHIFSLREDFHTRCIYSKLPLPRFLVLQCQAIPRQRDEIIKYYFGDREKAVTVSAVVRSLKVYIPVAVPFLNLTSYQVSRCCRSHRSQNQQSDPQKQNK